MWRRYDFLYFYQNIVIHHVEKILLSLLLPKYRYPLCGEDITFFPFTQISVSIMWRDMISSSEVPDKVILSCKPTSSKLLESNLLEKFISIVMFIIDSTTALRAFTCLCLTKGFPNVSHPNEPFDRTKSKINTVELCPQRHQPLVN